MESLPKVIAVIEDEIVRLDTILEKLSKDTTPGVASEQAGLGKLLAFAREIAAIQARFEVKLKSESPQD